MVVLLLISVMAALIIPEMKGTYEDALLRSSARQLVDVFTLAYSRAVSVNQLQRVLLDSRTGRYTIQQGGSPREAQGGLAPGRDTPGVDGTIDPRIAIEIRPPTANVADSTEEAPSQEADELQEKEMSEGIAFYPDGTADGRDILLRDRAGFHLVLQINPVTARVHLKELDHL
jgi:Tfp pilus assembly protein FimT